MNRSVKAARLAWFIRDEQERILEGFEDFARTHTSVGQTMDIEGLRDHAAGILAEIVGAMEQPQSEAAPESESNGDGHESAQEPETAAEKHGIERADYGFSLGEMVSEFRALRANVLRLWTEDHGAMDGRDLDDLIRFNEAIDTALAESVQRFAAGLDQSREMFLAVLGHDLRTPLNAIVTASSFLSTNGGLTGRNLKLAERIYSSGKRMGGLVGDLLDFTRARLGQGIPVTPVETDLAEVGRESVEACRALHPRADMRFEVSGNVQGTWDPSRLDQALCNLIGNAVEHGLASTPVVVTARGETDEVVVSVHNFGRVIEPEDQEIIFDPFQRIGEGEDDSLPHMGLGLYIAEQVALAHGGSIELHSTVDEGTTFELVLPRRVQP